MTNKLATQLPLLRKEAGISQGQLADKLNVSRQSVSKWENGTAIPDLDRIIEPAEFQQVQGCGLNRDRNSRFRPHH